MSVLENETSITAGYAEKMIRVGMPPCLTMLSIDKGFKNDPL